MADTSLFNASASITEKVSTESQWGAEVTMGSVFNKIRNTEVETLVNASTTLELVVPAGLLLGRVNSTLKVVPWVSTAEDGSQYPIGATAKPYTLAASAEIKMVMVTDGDIPEQNLAVAGAETLGTIVDGKTLKDRLRCDANIILTSSTENTTGEYWPS